MSATAKHTTCTTPYIIWYRYMRHDRRGSWSVSRQRDVKQHDREQDTHHLVQYVLVRGVAARRRVVDEAAHVAVLGGVHLVRPIVARVEQRVCGRRAAPRVEHAHVLGDEAAGGDACVAEEAVADVHTAHVGELLHGQAVGNLPGGKGGDRDECGQASAR